MQSLFWRKILRFHLRTSCSAEINRDSIYQILINEMMILQWRIRAFPSQELGKMGWVLIIVSIQTKVINIGQKKWITNKETWKEVTQWFLVHILRGELTRAGDIFSLFLQDTFGWEKEESLPRWSRCSNRFSRPNSKYQKKRERRASKMWRLNKLCYKLDLNPWNVRMITF